MPRKSPIQHAVSASKRARSFFRGKGQKTENPHGPKFNPAPRSDIFDGKGEPAKLELHKRSLKEKLTERFGKRNLEKEKKEKLEEREKLRKRLLRGMLSNP